MPLLKDDNKRNLVDIYEAFKLEHPEIAAKFKSYHDYRKVILELNLAAQDEILNKHILNLGHRMGSIALMKYKRKFRLTKEGKPMLPVDWGATKRLRDSDPQAKALHAKVYHTDPFYVGIVWKRTLCSLKGKVLYAFDSSRTNGQQCKTGLKNRLTQKIKEQPMFMESIKLAEVKFKRRDP